MSGFVDDRTLRLPHFSSLQRISPFCSSFINLAQDTLLYDRSLKTKQTRKSSPQTSRPAHHAHAGRHAHGMAEEAQEITHAQLLETPEQKLQANLLSTGLQAAERKRRSHQKSRKGCATCKKRKVKCSEEKPVCPYRDRCRAMLTRPGVQSMPQAWSRLQL